MFKSDRLRGTPSIVAGPSRTPGSVYGTSAGDLRQPDGLVKLFTRCHLEIVAAGDVEIPLVAPDDDILVRAVLLGEDPTTDLNKASIFLDVAQPFRTRSGSYLLINAFRYAIGILAPPLTSRV